jgi:capsule polysaccharide modification protein lipA
VKTALIFSRGIRNTPHLSAFLPDYDLKKTNPPQTVIGWGYKPTADKARAFAVAHNLPYTALEDGFLRSLGLGVEGYPPLSLIIDDIGIYYHTAQPSRLEQLIMQADRLPAELSAQAETAIRLIVGNRLSKYNHAADFAETDASKRPSEKPIVLLIDQTAGDMAVQYGGADEQTFQTMFQTALQENPQAEIWIKTHPDVLSGKRKGYLTDIAQQENIRLLAEDIHPISLLQQTDKVYCVTSQMGFEALLCGKPVTTFGLPWYAGWGVCDDRHPDIAKLEQSGRRAGRTLTQLFAAAYLQYSRYINPNTGQSGTIFDVIGYLARARHLNEYLRGNLYCIGVSLWKRAVIKPFFNVPACRLHFVPTADKMLKISLPPDARLLAWGGGKEAVIRLAEQLNLPLLRMEDGFIRSVGLGSNLVPPLSLVIDDMGIYFDPARPSRLEHILQHRHFDEHDRETAQNLQRELIEANISKYNVGRTETTQRPSEKRILLVPGQVEDDASIRLGAPEICRNLDLLRTVRERNPDAYIIYKPHPDVVSGNRIGAVPPEECARYADQTAAETDILTCLQHADEVHTMTSLTGFEALLRGKTVHCYGQPFYSGWGLTGDEHPLPRRTRKLELWQLIAGTLLHYPLYIHPDNQTMTDAATAAAILKKNKEIQKNGKLKQSWPSKQFNKIRQLWYSLK